MYYNLLYQCVFCLAFINFLIYWIDLFFFSFLKKSRSNVMIQENKFKQKFTNFEMPKLISGIILWFSLTLLILFRSRTTRGCIK